MFHGSWRQGGVGVGIAFGLAVGVLCCPGIAQAQGRGTVRISEPGYIRSPGDRSSVSTFQNYSSGLGALDMASSAPLGGGSVLQSSMGSGTLTFQSSGGTSSPLYSANSTGISAADQNILGRPADIGLYGSPRGLSATGGSYSRQIGSSSIGSVPFLDPVSRSQIPNSPLVSAPAYKDYTDPFSQSNLPGLASQGLSTPGRSLAAPGVPIAPAAPQAPALLSDAGGSGIGQALMANSSSPTAFGLARAFVQELERASTSLLRKKGEPITSLVPTEPSIYRTYILRGDRAFRQSNYREAYANFQIANDLGDHDAESYVCLLHAQFALSSVSYAQACYFLEQTLQHMPELPLANLRPRGFYDSPSKYAQQLVALQEHTEKYPSDHEAMLLLAYFRWFEQERDVVGTRNLLSRALAAGQEKRDPLVIEAVETFWRGVVATGAVSGELVPQPPKAPETMPAK